MPDKIGFGEAFDASFLKQMQDLNKEFKELLTSYKALVKEVKGNKELIQTAKSVADLEKASKKADESIKKLTATEKEQARLLKATEQATIKAAQATTKQGIALQKATEQKRRATAEAKRLAKAQLTGAKNTNTFGSSIKSFLFKANFLANVMSNVASVITRVFRKAIRGAFNTIKDFEQAMADVRSITGATDEEFKKLSDSARDLGRSTKFTAVEVAGLQKEYSKLGLTTEQILDAQAATLDLAAAFDTDLARSAEVVGITLKQFNLRTSETRRVVDVMAKSFASAPLDMERFAESMKFAGTAARVSGISLERTTAMLGQLAEAGLFGSQAGTALRQILIATSKESGTFAEKMERAAEKGFDLAGAAEEVQKRAATAFLVLKEGVPTIDAFEESLKEAGGTAEEMAEVQLDTLNNQLNILKSAWDGLLITLGETEGAVEGAKDGVGTLAAAINLLDNSIERSRKRNKEYQDETGKTKKSIISQIPVLGRVAEAWGLLGLTIKKAAQEAEDANIIDAFTGPDAGGVNPLETLTEDAKVVVESINTLQAEVAKLKARRNEASISEVGDINKEIAALERKLDKYKEIPRTYEDVSKLLKAIKADEVKVLEEEDQEYLESYRDVWDTIGTTTGGVIDEIQRRQEIALQEDLDRQQQKTANQKAAADEEIQIEKDKEARIREIKRIAIDATANALTGLTDLRIDELDRQLAAEVANIRASNKTQEEQARAISRIQKQQAEERKQLMLKQTYINIAAGIARAFVDYGWPLGLIAAAATGIEGGIQIAAIKAQQFAKGTDSSPEGVAHVGEKGAELRIDPDGKVSLTPKIDTLTYLKQGTKIVPADITNQILKYSAIANGLEGQGDDQTILMLMGKLDEVKRAIKNKPAASSTQTPEGIITATHKGNTTIINRRRYYT